MLLKIPGLETGGVLRVARLENTNLGSQLNFNF